MSKDKVRVLVTGGCGFIGSHVVDLLLEQGFEVFVYDRYAEIFRAPLTAVTYYHGELGNRGELEDVISKKMDVVVHLASSILPKTSNDDPVFDLQTNMVHSLLLFDLCVKYKVKKIIYASSGGTVYGAPQTLPITEEHPTNPICSYGIIKLGIEKYLHLYHHLHNLQYTILRFSNPYGIRQNPAAIQGVIPVFMNKILIGEEIKIWGDGTIIRDFVCVRDIAKLVSLAITSNACGIFNAGSGVGTSINKIIELLASVLHMTPTIVREPGRKFDVSSVILCPKKAENEFNWIPNTNIQPGIQEVANWIQTI